MFVARAQLRIDIGQPVERIGAGRGIAERRGKRSELAVERTLSSADPRIDLGAAFGVLEIEICLLYTSDAADE